MPDWRGFWGVPRGKNNCERRNRVIRRSRPCDETKAKLTQRRVGRLPAIVGLLRHHRSMGGKQVGERRDRARHKQGRGQQRDDKRCQTTAAISGGKLHIARVYLRFPLALSFSELR